MHGAPCMLCCAYLQGSMGSKCRVHATPDGRDAFSADAMVACISYLSICKLSIERLMSWWLCVLVRLLPTL